MSEDRKEIDIPAAETANAMSETLGEVTDIGDMRLDLTKDEKLRTVSLMLGIRYYVETIIKEASMAEFVAAREKELKFSNDANQAKEAELWHLRPASVNGVIGAALAFEQFLLGNYSPIKSVKVGDTELGSLKPEEPKPEGNGP